MSAPVLTKCHHTSVLSALHFTYCHSLFRKEENGKLPFFLDLKQKKKGEKLPIKDVNLDQAIDQLTDTDKKEFFYVHQITIILP